MCYYTFHDGIACMLLFLIATAAIVRGQTTTRLPQAPSYKDGVFTSPNTYTTQILDKGIEINVTWTTTYESVNLYLIFGTDYVNSKGLKLSTTDTFFLWTVDDAGNNSLPFSFRAVNAAGTTQEQTGGGFYTGQFWIRDRSANTAVTTSSAFLTTPESTSSAVSTAATTSATSSSDTPTVSEDTSSSTFRSTSESISSTVSATASNAAPSTSTMNKSSGASASATTGPSSSSSRTHVVIGVGVGIGAGVAALLIGAFVLWRRHHNRTKQRKADEMSSYLAESSGDQKSEGSFQMGQRPRPPHLPSYELAEQSKRSPVEVYDRWQEPRELPGSPLRR